MRIDADVLPASWTVTTLEAVADINPSGTSVQAEDDQPVSFLPMAAVEELSGRIDLSGQRAFGEVKKGFTRFRDGDLLFAKITPCMENGKAAVVRGLLGGIGCGSTEFHVLRPRPGVHPDFLRYFVVQSAFRQEARRNMQGAVGQQRVPVGFIREANLPLAPKGEQQRIVSKIDELFSRIDEGERALERVQKLVERYRQSVLKAAVTGELTRDWREKNKGKLESGETLLARILKARREAWEKAELGKMKAKGITPASDKWKQKYEEPSPTNTAHLPELPAGWAWASVDQLCREFGNGLSKKPSHHPPGIPILRISAVRPLAVDTTDLRYYVPNENELTDAFRVGDGDLLFTRYNGSKELVGISGVFRGSETVLHPDKLIRARVASEQCLNPDYLAIALNCGWSKKHLDQCVKTSAGQHGIAGSDIKRAPVPLPSFAEQGRLIDLVSLALSKCVDATATTASELRRAQASRQSILRSAFTGQLVPQDRSDEAASVLLERIANESVAAPATPKRGIRKKPKEAA